jgi:hypothetical protein
MKDVAYLKHLERMDNFVIFKTTNVPIDQEITLCIIYDFGIADSFNASFFTRYV